MNSQFIIALMEAVASYFSISLGFVLQKKGVGWIGYPGKKDSRYYQTFGIWLAGYALLNLAIIPNYFALRVLNPYLVNAVSGLNIVFMIFLSAWILKEKLFSLAYFFTGIICLSIATINLVEHNTNSSPSILPGYAYLAALVPITLFLGWILLRFWRILTKESRLQAVLLASAGGGMSGLMVTYLKLLQLECGTNIVGYLTSPYLYLLLAVSVLSMIAIQMAYKMGDMILVGPAQFASMVFYPVVSAYFIFQSPVNPIQIICFAVIIIAVILMVYSHSAKTAAALKKG